MKNNPAKIRYQSTLEQTIPISKHNRYVSNLTKYTYDTFDKQQFLSYHDQLKSIHNKKMSICLDKDITQCDELQRQSKTLLQSIEQLIERSQWMSRHQRIRINEWLVKLTYKQLNPVWKKNVIFYLSVLLEMLHKQKIGEPFVSLPNDGPLPKLTIYDIPYPIREKFAQSKEKSQRRSDFSKGSKDSKSVTDKTNVKKQNTNNTNYEISILDKNCSWFENNSSILLNTYENESQFEGRPFQIKMPMKPVFSNDKSRKNTINRVSQNSNKISGNKDKAKVNTAKRIVENNSNFYESDKENNPNSANIKRQLFKSKDKHNHPQIQPTKKQQMDKQQISYTTNQSITNKQKFNVIPKVYELLHKNQEKFSSQPIYSQLLLELTSLGKQLSIEMPVQNQTQQLDNSILSQNSKAFIKASEQIRSKFKQTDNQTLQFMNYLKKLKQKDKRI